MNKPGIFCAIDTPDLAAAMDLANALGDAVDGIKLGLEFFGAQGPAGGQGGGGAASSPPLASAGASSKRTR